MRITLPSGTEAELARPSAAQDEAPTTGLVIVPDIFGLRPLFDDLCARLADEWNVVVSRRNRSPGWISVPTSTPAEPRSRRWTTRIVCGTSVKRPMPRAASASS